MEGTHVALVLVVFAVVFVAFAAFAIGMNRIGSGQGPALAEVNLGGAVPFAFQVPPAPGPVALWLRIEIEYPREISSQNFGLVLRLDIDGHPSVHGCGKLIPPGVPPIDADKRAHSTTSNPSRRTMRYTVALAELPRGPANVRGHFEITSPQTILQRTRIWATAMKERPAG